MSNQPIIANLIPRTPSKGFNYGLHVLRSQPKAGLTHGSRSKSKYTRHVGAKQKAKAALKNAA